MSNRDEIIISVIMGVYNQWNVEELHASVVSILNQSFRNLEFIIYDDGSDSEVAKVIKELAQLDKRIVVIGRSENHGLAFSLNSCIHVAKGKYIARMDADDISHRERLAVQYDFLEKHPEYAWCGCNAMVFDESGIWGSRNMPEEPEKRDYLKYSPFIHPSVMYRSEIFKKEREVYLVSEKTLRCEDYELFMRLQKRGLRGYNIQRALFWYRENRQSFQKRKFSFRINEAKIRCRNFKELGIMFPVGWFYCLRPIIGGLMPNSWISYLKHKEAERRKYERRCR